MAGGGTETTKVGTTGQRGLDNIIAQQLAVLLGREQGFPQLGYNENRIPEGQPVYQGTRVADFIPEFNQLRNQLQGYNINPYQREQNLALQNALAGLPSYNLQESDFDSQVTRPLLRTFDTEINPRLQAGFAGQGASFSSRRGYATQQALEDLGTQLASERARFYREDRNLAASLAESAANRQLQAVGLADAASASPLGRASALQSVLSPYQQREQQLILADMARFQEGLPINNPALQLAQNYLGISQTVTQPKSLDPAAQAGILAGSVALGALTGGVGFGALGALAGAAGAGLTGLRGQAATQRAAAQGATTPWPYNYQDF